MNLSDYYKRVITLMGNADKREQQIESLVMSLETLEHILELSVLNAVDELYVRESLMRDGFNCSTFMGWKLTEDDSLKKHYINCKYEEVKR